jgi:protein STE50
MEKYGKQAGDNTYDSDAEADDEFERSDVGVTSPTVPEHFDEDLSDHPSESDDDRGFVDGEDTPTTQGWADREGRSPMGKITQWSEEQAADYIGALSPALKQYGQALKEEAINGQALVSLGHDELKELGIHSIGHRLTILKAVYEQKLRSGVKIEEGDYVPLSAEGEKADLNATQDDIARIIESIRLRDQRIIAAEAELRAMKQDLDRISDENRKLREETLPIMRMVKDQRTPLPDPAGGTIPSPRDGEAFKQAEPPTSTGKGSSLSRKFSTKKLFLGGAPKQTSPTHPPTTHAQQAREVRDDGGGHLEASAAAMAASNHLTASMTSQTSPNSVHGQQLSPTSPAYSHAPSSGGSYHHPNSTAQRSFPRDTPSTRHDRHTHDDTGTSHSIASQWSTASTVVPDQGGTATRTDRSRRGQAPTPSPRDDDGASTRERGDRYDNYQNRPAICVC